MLTSLLTLRDIHVCSTGLYKLSQKGLWSDTSPWCSLSERARTLIYNSLLVTRLTPIFFFLQKGTPAVSAVTCERSVLTWLTSMSLSHPLLSPLPPFPRTSTTPAWLAMPLHCHVKLVCVIKWSQVKRLAKLLEFGQNASESIPYFHEYTIWLEITLTLVGFWLAKRGIERFLEKRGCRNYFRPISKSRWSRFWWVSKSLFWGGRGGDFCVLVWNFILLLILLFFAYGPRTLGFVIFSFRLVFRSRIFQSS